MTGLINLGNTCFISSVLQGISSSRNVLDSLRECPIQPNFSMKDAAVNVLIRLGMEETISGKAFAPTSFVQLLREKYKSFGMAQQDAEEVFLILADALFDDDLPKDDGLGGLAESNLISYHTSISVPFPAAHSLSSQYLIFQAGTDCEEIKEDFGIFHCAQQEYTPAVRRLNGPHPLRGFLTSTLRCSVCGGHHEIKVDPFFDLSLTIPSLSFGSSTVYLEECLRSWSEPETVCGALCDRCLLTGALDALEKRRRQIQTCLSVMPTHSRKDLEFSLAKDIECLSISRNSLASSSLPEALRSLCRQALDGQLAGIIVKRLSIARPPKV